MKKSLSAVLLAVLLAGAILPECMGEVDTRTPEALITGFARCAQEKNADGIMAHFTPAVRKQMLNDRQHTVKIFEKGFYGKMEEVGYALPKDAPAGDRMEMLVMWQMREERTFDGVIFTLQKIRGNWFIDRLDDAPQDDPRTIKKFGKMKTFRVSKLPKGKTAPVRKPASR